jgi:valyl-tRNA synthetase
VHRAPWPDAEQLRRLAAGAGRENGETLALEVTADVLHEIRKAKSAAGVPMRAEVQRVTVSDTAERLRALELGSDDLRSAGSIDALELAEAAEFAVEVVLAGR